MKILKLAPVYKDYIWGGETLKTKYGKSTDMTPLAESWELSCHKDGKSTVVGEDCTLEDYLREHPEALGEGCNGELPILIKLIDAADRLSVQVHPNNEQAHEWEGQNGKTEMWYVVDADPGSRLRSGFAKQVTPEEYEQSIADNTITDLLKEYDIHKGDVFFLPAGRIHSIGAGAFIAEIQQTSNITYRIYDFNRCDDNGNPRELHTEMSKGAIDYTVLPDYRTYYDAQPDKATQLVSCRYFTTDIYRLTKEYDMPLAELDSFVILICTAGKGTITDNNGNTMSIHQGESILVPATTTGFKICPEGEMELLGSWIEE